MGCAIDHGGQTRSEYDTESYQKVRQPPWHGIAAYCGLSAARRSAVYVSSSSRLSTVEADTSTCSRARTRIQRQTDVLVLTVAWLVFDGCCAVLVGLHTATREVGVEPMIGLASSL